MVDTCFIGIIAAGRYPHERLPVGLRDALEQEIQKHMEAYGLQKVVVVTEEDDRKRAYAKELYESVTLFEALLDFMILTVKMPPGRLDAFNKLHKKTHDLLLLAGPDNEQSRALREELEKSVECPHADDISAPDLRRGTLGPIDAERR